MVVAVVIMVVVVFCCFLLLSILLLLLLHYCSSFLLVVHVHMHARSFVRGRGHFPVRYRPERILYLLTIFNSNSIKKLNRCQHVKPTPKELLR